MHFSMVLIRKWLLSRLILISKLILKLFLRVATICQCQRFHKLCLLLLSSASAVLCCDSRYLLQSIKRICTHTSDLGEENRLTRTQYLYYKKWCFVSRNGLATSSTLFALSFHSTRPRVCYLFYIAFVAIVLPFIDQIDIVYISGFIMRSAPHKHTHFMSKHNQQIDIRCSPSFHHTTTIGFSVHIFWPKM